MSGSCSDIKEEREKRGALHSQQCVLHRTRTAQRLVVPPKTAKEYYIFDGSFPDVDVDVIVYRELRGIQSVMEMEKSILAKLVKSNSDRVKLVNYDGGKSDVWASFVKVHVDDKFTYFVKCNSCATLLKRKAKDGTSGLKAHTKSCPAQRSKTAVTPLARFLTCESATPTSPSQHRHLTATDRAAVTESIVRFVLVISGHLM